jgi:hypothetical protein
MAVSWCTQDDFNAMQQIFAAQSIAYDGDVLLSL